MHTIDITTRSLLPLLLGIHFLLQLPMTNIFGWLLPFFSIFKIQWTEIKPSADPKYGIPLPRSSHGVSTIADRIYVYGGENVARTPLEDDQSLWCAYKNTSSEWAWKLVNLSADASRPSKRLGHAQCATESKIYVFGGRAGTASRASG